MVEIAVADHLAFLSGSLRSHRDFTILKVLRSSSTLLVRGMFDARFINVAIGSTVKVTEKMETDEIVIVARKVEFDGDRIMIFPSTAHGIGMKKVGELARRGWDYDKDSKALVNKADATSHEVVFRGCVNASYNFRSSGSVLVTATSGDDLACFLSSSGGSLLDRIECTRSA